MRFSPLLSSLTLVAIPSVVSAAQCTGSIGSISSYIAALPAAQSFCSSKYPLSTVTSTSTALPVTSTTTVATAFVNTTVATSYTNITAATSIVTLNLTSTVTANTTTTTTASTTITTTTTATETTTETDTSVSTSTATTTVSVYSAITKKKKRYAPYVQPAYNWAAVTSAAAVPAANPAASAWNAFMSTGNAAAGSICTCIETAKSTTITVTPTSTKSVTATSTVPVTAKSTNSLTATTTTTLLFTSTTTTTLTATSTTTFTNTASTTTTVTTTTTSTSTTVTTSTATATIAPPVCNAPNADAAGSGGCSSNCFCDGAVNGQGYCTSNGDCQNACTTDADCGTGSFCSNRPLTLSICGHSICESFNGCTSSYTPSKRSLNMLGMSVTERLGRTTRVNEARSAWNAREEERRATCSPTNIRC